MKPRSAGHLHVMWHAIDGGHSLTPHEELFALSEKLKAAAATGEGGEIGDLLAALDDAAHAVGRSFSGSWQGYHSRVYYADFLPPPPGAHFSQEWGLMDNYMSSLGSRGDWREYDSEVVKEHIRHMAGDPDLGDARAVANKAAEVFEYSKSELVSILQSELDDRDDSFLENLKAQMDKQLPMSPFEIAQTELPPTEVGGFARFAEDWKSTRYANRAEYHVLALSWIFPNPKKQRG